VDGGGVFGTLSAGRVDLNGLKFIFMGGRMSFILKGPEMSSALLDLLFQYGMSLNARARCETLGSDQLGSITK
jgi:hypothetical protein